MRHQTLIFFTEHGAIMLASLLNTRIAVQASVQVVRAFVRLREILATHKDLAHKLEELEKKYDAQFKVVFDAIRELMAPAEKARRCPGVRLRGFRCRCWLSLSPRQLLGRGGPAGVWKNPGGTVVDNVLCRKK
jgi:hypothetical protein